MPTNSRADFNQKTLLQIAKRAGWLCSFPSCRTPTVGATEDGQGEINIGTAAHICAAAPGGPRYDEKMSDDERSSADNGIWMCRDHGKAIDSDVKQFTVAVLREWKRQAEQDSWRRVLRNEVASAPAAAGDATLTARLREASQKDLGVFRETAKWPYTSVALLLEVDGFDTPVETDALARAVTSLDDLILVAGPGMGKTTTVFQIAEGVLANADGIPLIVPLNDWATEGATVLESILQRPAFKGISEDDFRRAATQPGVVLLLDGWNELDADARKRARVQVNTLKAELPELSLVVSTRKPRNQALDVPFGGKRVDLLPLSEVQQMRIARDRRGEEGEKLLDQAWRTAGVRELVTIPLYLTALLLLPKDTPFPTTREEVLRHFVAAHEKETSRAEALHAIVQDFQLDYLNGLAVFATQTSNTAIADSNARRSISETVTVLVDNGQITIKPEPNAVLDVLVSSHVLMRAGDTPGVSFQHQQFQEWYASHSVERRILAEVDDLKKREALKAEIFNYPAWEEAILFAVERMSRGEEHQRVACGKAIPAAYEVDPMLAAEMIFRATDDVWAPIAVPIQALVKRWHAPKTVDRAFRFMLMSGRAEFLDAVWPLITDTNEQISLKALRNCKRFRPSVLGDHAAQKIKALPQKPRLVLLDEVASHSGMDGLDLATAIAKDDPDPEVRASVIDALAFRRADRHVADILHTADDKTFDLVARRGIIDEVDNEDVRRGIEAARKRLAAKEDSVADRLRLIAYAEAKEEDRSAELTEIVSTMEIEKKQDAEVQLVYEARNRYARAVADGLLARVRSGRKLFYGADDMLASAGFFLEDKDLLQLAMANPVAHDERADAAASVLGPKCAGQMIDALLELSPRIRTDRAASETFNGLERRIAHVPGSSLVAAVAERSPALNNEQMARLAALVSRRPDGDSERGRPFDADAVRTIRALVEDWGKRMLADDDADRWQKAAVATLASHVPDVSLLPLMKEMLDDNLRRLRGFRGQLEAEGRLSEARHEVSSPMTGEYQWAFLAIKSPETAVLMKDYLEDLDFGSLAARVLADQWRTANEPPNDKRFLGGVDWSDVSAKRAARAGNPGATCDEAEAIFAAIDRLIVDGTTEKQQRLAVALGITALKLPHGQRPETIRKLISLAPREGYKDARSDLLLSLVLSGEEVDVGDVVAGINETMEAAKTQQWILTQSDGFYVKVWLRLLPFVNRPVEGLAALLGLPPRQRDVYFLRDLVRSYAHAPADAGEQVLFGLAEADVRVYGLHEWRDAVIALNTASSARRFVDLVANGTLTSNSNYDSHTVRQVGGLLSKSGDLRRHVYGLLKEGASTPGLAILAGAVAENPDEEGLLLLVACEQQGRAFRHWRMIERAVTEHVPVNGYANAYNVVPVPAPELRRKLFAMTTDGGPKDIAARWLTHIDTVRDEYGLPEGEPRHPDLASCKPWPIMTPDPEATAD